MTYLDAVGYSSIVFYGVVVPLCLAYLYARQHLALLPGKTTTAVALRDGDQWEIRLSELEGEKNFSPVPLTQFTRYTMMTTTVITIITMMVTMMT